MTAGLPGSARNEGSAGSAGSVGTAGPAGTAGSAGSADLSRRLRPLVRDLPDVPVPGVVFRDITPLLADGPAFAAAVEALAQRAGEVDVVVAVEARGFLLGAPVAIRLGVGLVPVRKSGKLPGRTLTEDFALEYGSTTVEVHADAFLPGQRVLLVDDVLATGGTAAAAVGLVRRAGGEPVALGVLIELLDLRGRERLPGLRVEALLSL